MKKAAIITLILLSILTLSLIIKPEITGNSIKNKYSYTYAICNSDNYCEDYYIECENKQIKALSPTGFSIQQSKNWEDTRPEITNFCE